MFLSNDKDLSAIVCVIGKNMNMVYEWATISYNGAVANLYLEELGSDIVFVLLQTGAILTKYSLHDFSRLVSQKVQRQLKGAWKFGTTCA